MKACRLSISIRRSRVRQTYDDGLGLWRVDYLITATNSSDDAGTYDVIDTFDTGVGITLDLVNTVAIYQNDETLDGTPGAFPIDNVIVTDEMLAAGASESWLVEAYFLVDPGMADPGTAGCDPRPGTPGAGTGFYNSVAGAPVDPDPTNDQDCEGLPLINLEKTVNGPAVYDIPTDRFIVEYTITATNLSTSAGMYDVIDVFDPGTGITLDTALTTDTYQGGTMGETETGTPGAFPVDTVIVTDEALQGGASESWLVEAYFEVDLTTVEPGTSGCDPRPGDPIDGTGFYNSVAGSPSDPDPVDDEDCTGVPDPVIDLSKESLGLVDNGGGAFTVTFRITAENEGEGPGLYDLIDTIDPGEGINVVDARLTEYQAGSEDDQSGTLAGPLPYSFISGETLVTDEQLNPGMDESWIVVVDFQVDPSQVGADYECNGGPGAGAYNRVDGSDTDPDPGNNDDCEDPPLLTTSFVVTKDFSDDNPMNVTVSLSCNTGLPLYQEAQLGEFQNPFNVIEFIIGDFIQGELDCEIQEVVPDGYLPTYTAGFTTGIADDVFPLDGGPDGCFYEGIQGGQFTCDIFNELQPVDVVVEKIWIDENPQFMNPEWVEITLQCDGPIDGGYPCDLRRDRGAQWQLLHCIPSSIRRTRVSSRCYHTSMAPRVSPRKSRFRRLTLIRAIVLK